MLRPDDARPGTVLCHGVFDLLHLGHIRHLKEARSLGDRLVVSITADRHVEQRKGKGRPQFSVEQRREALKLERGGDDAPSTGRRSQPPLALSQEETEMPLDPVKKPDMSKPPQSGRF